MLKQATLTIASDAEGAGDIDYNDRFARIDSVAPLLCDFVYEGLQEHGVNYGTVIDARVYAAIEHIVASAMIAQYDHDAKSWGEVIAAIANRDWQQQAANK
jgi:hypothetical protein